MATVRGALDKEIIRRIVRRHLNEVKYCYDQALARQPKLDGRMVAQFTISGTRPGLASVRSELDAGLARRRDVRDERDQALAVPGARKGGLAIVSYPFTFSPAGNSAPARF